MKFGYLQALLIAVACPLGALAQGQAEQPIEETVVVGKQSMAEMRRQVWQYEEDFYSIYNKLNDDNEFDVRCFYETPTGTRIKNHVCRAKFITNAYSDNVGRKRISANRTSRQDDNPQVAAKTLQFQEKLETLVATDPELQAAFVRYSTARARFMEEYGAEGEK